MWTVTAAVLLTSAAVLVAIFIHLAPPRTITIATGPHGGAYRLFAERYRQSLEKHGVVLRLLETSGAAENLAMISLPTSRVDAALVQGGLADAKSYDSVRSLGRFFYEPLWIFHRLPTIEHRLVTLLGKRIAIGAAGSGTQILARKLLTANGIDEHNSRLLELGFDQSVEAIREGSVDAAILVASASAPAIRTLLSEPGIQPLVPANAPAYVRRFPFLAQVDLPRGGIDLASQSPGSSIPLLATTGTVLVRNDLHPALIYLLTEVAGATHSAPGLLEGIGEFPKQNDPEFEMAEAAVRYYRHGAPFLHRHLSFWMAELAERLIVIGLPLLAIAFPLAKGLKLLYQWAVRWRIKRWYLDLKALEDACHRSLDLSEIQLARGRLDAIAEDVRSAPVPFEFASEVQVVTALVRAIRAELDGQLLRRDGTGA